MQIWTALIILQVTGANISDLSGPTQIQVGTTANNPGISLDVHAPHAATIGRMTGVETSVVVNVPSAVIMTFASEALCKAAENTLAKKGGVLSVACVHTSDTP